MVFCVFFDLGCGIWYGGVDDVYVGLDFVIEYVLGVVLYCVDKDVFFLFVVFDCCRGCVGVFVYFFV